MIQSSRQLKDLIRNLARDKAADAQVLMRNYMMERFLERVSISPYRDDFILKGGMLVAAMVGLDARSTMDIDATIHGKMVSVDDISDIISEIVAVPIDDGVKFVIKSISEIMDEAEYPGLRVSLESYFDGVRTPLKIDISTGDIITPREIRYRFRLMFEDRSIEVWAYNLETVLAEKIETLISRTTTNSRMRDFYDIYILTQLYGTDLDIDVLTSALAATAGKRGHTELLKDAEKIISDVQSSGELQELWRAYQKKFSYAADIPWSTVIRSVRQICQSAGLDVRSPSVLAQLREPVHGADVDRAPRSRNKGQER